MGLGVLLLLTPLAMADPLTSDEREFGRLAFVPDWSAAERLDRVATDRFLSAYWPKLHPRYEKGGLPNFEDQRANSAGKRVRLFIAPYTRAVTSDYLPSSKEDIPESVRLIAALGESEPFLLGVRSLDSSRSVKLLLSAFESEQGTIGIDNVSIRLALAYPAYQYAGKRKYRLVERPMVLVVPPEEVWEFPPYTSHAYLIDLHIPLGTSPGLYKGTLSVVVDNLPEQNIQLDLKVLPFRLRQNGFNAGAFGIAHDLWAGGFTGYYPEMMEMDSRYGFNLAGAFYNKGQEIPFSRDGDGVLIVDTNDDRFVRLDATLGRLGKYGMGGVVFWNWGGSGKVKQFNAVLKAAGFPGIETPAGKLGFAEICAAIKSAEQRHGWPEIVINPFDEALKDQDATRAIIEAIPLVKRYSPKTRLYMTEWHDGYTRLYQSSGATLGGKQRPRESEYSRLLRSGEQPRLNFDVIGSNVLSRESRALQMQLGGEYWHYTTVNRLSPQARFAYGLQPYAVKSESALTWANYKGGLDGKGWTLHYAMPDLADGRKKRNTRGPVIASPRAIAVREGIDDRRYIETLRYHAMRLESQENLAFLDELSLRIARELRDRRLGGSDNLEAEIADETFMQGVRGELIGRIESLLEAERMRKQSGAGE